MQTIQQQIQSRIDAALAATFPEAINQTSPAGLRVVPATNPQFGDYQFNGALPLKKVLGSNPREIAQQIIAKLEIDDISETPEIAGPGFINFRLKREFLQNRVSRVLSDTRLGVPSQSTPRCVVVDFSAPNVAKPMHVGHIRSTILGDCLARLLRFAGHEVVTDNHIGDWGTQFGKLIVGWKNHLDEQNLQHDPIGEMERLYKLVNAQSEEDEAVADAARAEVAKLQTGDEENLAIWRRLRELSQAQFDAVYGRLNVSFDESLGESFYNEQLPQVVSELKSRGLAEDSEGAVVVRFEEPPQLADKAMLIQKSDGAFNYATTDLATLLYRVQRWKPNEVLYVVDARQSLHFQQLFATAQMLGLGETELRHISFGSILGEDGKPLKTRSGETIKLLDLLDEAESRAFKIAQEKSPELSQEQQREIARVIGIGAVKYSDLAQNRTTDYIFSWDKMLALQGNSAPYLLYSYVRIRSIFRKAEGEIQATPQIELEHATEVDLAKHLLRFGEAALSTLEDYRPNALTDYLFELAQKFNAFFEHCPVLKAEASLRDSRLALCKLTADALQKGLNLLGIETIEQM